MEEVKHKKPVSMLTQNMNVHYFVPHSYNFRESRVKGLIQILDGFDVICLQEIFTFNLFGIGSALRSEIVDSWAWNSVLSKSPPFLQQDTGLMILTKFPVLESTTIFYDDRNPKEIFSKKGALRAKIQISDDDSDYIYAHVPEIRKKQLQQLMDELVTPIADERIVLAGDLNVNCPSLASKTNQKLEYHQLLNVLSPLQDLRQLGNIESEPTYQDGNPCLDYIFLRNVNCDFSSFTVQKNWKDSEGVSISDHFGLSVNLLL